MAPDVAGVDDVGGVEVPEAEVVGVDAAGSTSATAVDKLDEVAATTPATAAVGDAVVAVVCRDRGGGSSGSPRRNRRDRGGGG